jgi:hypothetical protein
MDTMCMTNLAELCAGDSASCTVEDRAALAAWAAELADLSTRLGAEASDRDRPPSRRDVQSLMSSISACLSLEVKHQLLV